MKVMQTDLQGERLRLDVNRWQCEGHEAVLIADQCLGEAVLTLSIVEHDGDVLACCWRTVGELDAQLHGKRQANKRLV